MSLLRKVVRGIARLSGSRPADPRIELLHTRRLQLAPATRTPAEAAPVLAVQGVEDPLFFGLFSALAQDIKAATGCRAALLQVRGINGAIGAGWLAFLLRSWPVCALANRQWANAYRDLVGQVAYRSHSIAHPLHDLADWFRAGRLWRSLQDQRDISTLAIDGVAVGDLIIDSFLRFRPSPRFDVRDPFVRRVLWQCLRDLRRAKDWFGRVRPAMYISSYATYVEHGVAVRVALSLGTPVRVYGNLIVFGKRLNLDDMFHTANCSQYRRAFEALPDQEERIAQADRQLGVRMAGGIDAATAYMQESAYADRGEEVPDVRGAVVVFLHDFYDSPHIFADLVFPDFWAWVDCTVRTLRESGIAFWIKPHPNQIALSSAVLDELRVAHPDVRFISKGITNAQLVKAGMVCGVTVYGTVAHELAYLGVPTIACARHPHHAFDFCRTATDVATYQGMLRTPDLCPLPRDAMKRQALAFYYMHNLHGSSESLEVRHAFATLWKTSHTPTAAPGDLRDQLDRLHALPGWRTHVDALVQEMTDRVR